MQYFLIHLRGSQAGNRREVQIVLMRMPEEDGRNRIGTKAANGGVEKSGQVVKGGCTVVAIEDLGDQSGSLLALLACFEL